MSAVPNDTARPQHFASRQAKYEQYLRELGVKETHIRASLHRLATMGENLSTIMKDYGFLSSEGVAKLEARVNGLEYYDPSSIDTLNIGALEAKQVKLDKFEQFVPVAIEDDTLVIAVPNLERQTPAEVSFRQFRKRRFVVASQKTITNIYRRYFSRSQTEFREAVKSLYNAFHNRRGADEDVTLVRSFLGVLLRHAIYSNASDIYLSQSEKIGVIKIKVDGVAHIAAELLPEAMQRIVNILITDGKLKVDDIQTEVLKEGSIDNRADQVLGSLVDDYVFRLELGQAVREKTAQIRILEKSNESADFLNLGFDYETTQKMLRWAHSGAGLVLITGPTGSGKTTTLYSLLKEIDPEAYSIQSIENPVEYSHGLWMQYEVPRNRNDEAEVWGKVLKGMLRNAPDVILLGEIRESEPAKVAFRAANTGHLVFTTLHTNTAAGAVAQLRRMGVDPDDAASEMLGVLSQRLVRKLCVHCRKPEDRHEVSEELKRIDLVAEPTLFRAEPDGCPACNHRGYRGRALIYELLDFGNPKVRKAVEDGEHTSAIAAAGLTPETDLFGRALYLLASGVTSIEEIDRVVPLSYR